MYIIILQSVNFLFVIFSRTSKINEKASIGVFLFSILHRQIDQNTITHNTMCIMYDYFNFYLERKNTIYLTTRCTFVIFRALWSRKLSRYGGSFESKNEYNIGSYITIANAYKGF